jgi:hypothetical protein
LKKVLILLLFLLAANLMWLSCGGSSSGSSGTKTSGIAFRAFITNSVSSGSVAAGVYIVNAQTDVRPIISPIAAGNTPGMMVLTPNHAETLVFSGNGTASSDNQFTIINNAGEAASAHVILPGMTQSFVVSPDSSTAYVAVPTAPVTGQSPGVIDVISLNSGTVTAQISCPTVNSASLACAWPAPVPQGLNQPYQFLSIGNTGNRLLAFSQGSDSVANTVAVVTPSNVATANPLVTFVAGNGATSFDHPIWAFFNSDDTTAYVLNCGAECGGKQASVQPLDMTTTPPTPGTPVPVPAATVALVNNSTLYLAGTPVPNPNPQPCTGQTTQATSCGLLTIFDLNTMSHSAPIVITDGYHTNLSLGSNGQLFIGARTCTEVIAPVPPPAGAEVRGCLSIYNTATGAVVIPPENGDVTGIQPIATRDVVYVIQGQSVQGGSLYLYDTTTDALYYNPNDPNNPGQISNLVGDFVDVITPDF